MNFVKRIAGAALAAALMLGSGLMSPQARAGYVVTLLEVGGDIVATGSGPLDLTGLAPAGLSGSAAVIQPGSGLILSGPANSTSISIAE